MGDNSAQQAIQKAREGIATLSADLLALDAKITQTGAKALEMSAKFGAKTPGDMTKQINAQIDAIKKLDAATTSSQKAREAQIMKESNLRENLRKQRNKEETDNFKNAQRATAARKQAAAQEEKILNKQISEMKKRESAIKKTSDLEFKYSQQKIKAEEAMFQQLIKSTQIKKAAAAEEERMAAKQLTLMKKRESALKRSADLEYSYSQKKIKAEEAAFQQLVKSSKARKKFDADNAKAAEADAKAAASKDKLSGAYAQLLAQMNAQKVVLKNNIIEYGKKHRLTVQAQKDYDILAHKIRAANMATAQSNSLMKTAALRLQSLAVAFGFFGTIYLIANAIKDSISRIREFDKEMQNMVGVTRSTREELGELEGMIKAVAGQSVMTSNEVAKLATSLLVLGKSKEDVMSLLKPANDLGIALNTTSEAAGEFLVQSLNSFGAGAESATEFADVIATIRTSTSLDFQKMRDSFQYLSPVSRALGEDLAYTGAVIGILADNGLKAQQAGRTLATAQQRLSRQGIHLADALQDINDATDEGKSKLEVLALANKLFGAEAGKSGLILANNSDLIQKNAQAIRDNGGALDDLIDGQMESFDAKMKILDSTWEEWLLSLQAGEGVMGKLFLGAVQKMTDFFQVLVDVNKSFAEFKAIGKADGNVEMTKYLTKEMQRLGLTMNEVAEIEFDNVQDKLKVINAELVELRLQREKIKNEKGGTWFPGLETARLFFNEMNTKKWTEAQAKANEYMNVIREAKGEMRELDQATADAFDSKETDHMTAVLPKMKYELWNILDTLVKMDSRNPDFKALKGEYLELETLIGAYEDAIDKKKEWFSITDFNAEGNEVDAIKDKIYWEKELKAAKKDHGETLKEDDGGRAAAQARIDIAEEELKIWELRSDAKKKAGEEEKLVMKGSVAALEEIKSALEDEQKRLETTTEGWKEKQKEIDGVTERIEHLKRGLDSVGNIETAEFDMGTRDDGNSYLTDQVNREKEMSAIMRSIKEADFTYLAHLENDELAREKELNDERLRMAKELGEEQYKAAVKFGEKELSDLEKVQSKRRDMVGDSIQKILDMEAEAVEAKKDLQEGLNDILMEVGDQLLQKRILDVDEEIQANERLYAEKLDNDNLSTEQRDALEAERDRKDVELQEKRRKREKQNFLIQQGMALAGIAITLAQTLAAIKLGGTMMIAQGGLYAVAPAAAYMAAATSTAFQSAALSAGMVLAQGISQYKTGRKDGPEEVAILGDGGKHEPILDKYGNLKGISPNKPTFMHLDKGDSVLPSTNHLSKDYQSILNATTMTTLAAASVSNDPDKLARIFDAKLSNLRTEMKSGIKEGFTGIKLPGNKDISKLANELKFNRKRDAL